MSPKSPTPITPQPMVRFARPATDLTRSAQMYVQGLELEILAQWEDHDGFDGVVLGAPGGAYQIEFTLCRHHPVAPTPTPEDLLVIYEPDEAEWTRRCQAMLNAGFTPTTPLNPYWLTNAKTFQDPDTYQVIIRHQSW